ncbi:MAG: CPBP family intramembrane metalloprotease [Clostridia bacterium]|nr:CPBP family intramembrane metalloprotease [Clostridia bacterium]
MKRNIQIGIIVIISCVVLNIIDAVIMPGYIIKSLVKAVMFLLAPILYARAIGGLDLKNIVKPNKKGLMVAFMWGIGVYIVVLGAYLIFKDIFDFSALTTNLTKTTGVNKSNFLWVAVYISFINSFLEEFFFRGFAFLKLKEVASRKTAYLLSSFAFALYHIGMMIGWFGLPVVLISLIGLFVGGIIFNRLDEARGTIHLSWLVHMFANFATNTIGFILFAV